MPQVDSTKVTGPVASGAQGTERPARGPPPRNGQGKLLAKARQRSRQRVLPTWVLQGTCTADRAV